MEVLTVIGCLLAIVVGMLLGMIGSGGSVLTVPVLVYVLGIDPVKATAYSLFIVGVASLAGAGNYMQKKLVNYKTVLIFGLPALIAVYCTRKMLVPALPDILLTINGFVLTREAFIMMLFAALMVAAAVSMIRKPSDKKLSRKQPAQKFNYPLIIGEGLVVGVFTGLVGAGGGFMIIPALVLLGNLPMKQAVGTSLLIIAIKSLTGFLGDVDQQNIRWGFLLTFSGLTVGGILLGTYLNRLIPAASLKKGFGWFILIMGMLIIWMEGM